MSTRDEQVYRGEDLIFPSEWYGFSDEVPDQPNEQEMSDVLEMVNLQLTQQGPEWLEMTDEQRGAVNGRISEIQSRYQISERVADDTAPTDDIPF